MMRNIYTRNLREKLFNANVILNWYLALEERNRPAQGTKIFEVWWERNGSKMGHYDLFHFVGVCDATNTPDWNNRRAGGVITLPKVENNYELFRHAYALERKLKRRYPEYQAI